MTYIKQNWRLIVSGLCFVAVALLVVAFIGSLQAQVSKQQANIGELNVVANEIVNTSNNGSIASSTDFVKAVYYADAQIQQQLQLQQQAQKK